jgi:hypothetical protein
MADYLEGELILLILERRCFEGRYALPVHYWKSSQSPTTQNIEPPGLGHTSIAGEPVSYRLLTA